jgi:hypothetical protein
MTVVIIENYKFIDPRLKFDSSFNISDYYMKYGFSLTKVKHLFWKPELAYTNMVKLEVVDE